MKTYVITFSKVGIRNGWVEVTAWDEDIARAWARKEYGIAWSMIYAIPGWTSEQADLFPLGCIGRTVLHHEKAEHI